MLRSVIAATGSHIPPIRVPNSEFLNRDFRAADGSRIHKTNEEIVNQFEAITGIKERRYVADGTVTSDIAYAAASEALTSSGIDRESLDLIIVAHNFGDVQREGGSLTSFRRWRRASRHGCASPSRTPPPSISSSAARDGSRGSSPQTP